MESGSSDPSGLAGSTDLPPRTRVGPPNSDASSQFAPPTAGFSAAGGGGATTTTSSSSLRLTGVSMSVEPSFGSTPEGDGTGPGTTGGVGGLERAAATTEGS